MKKSGLRKIVKMVDLRLFYVKARLFCIKQNIGMSITMFRYCKLPVLKERIENRWIMLLSAIKDR